MGKVKKEVNLAPGLPDAWWQDLQIRWFQLNFLPQGFTVELQTDCLTLGGNFYCVQPSKPRKE